MISRTIFSSEHENFRASVRRFYQDEIMPCHEQWEEQQMVDRNIWRRAGELGMLCMTMPEEYGGAGADRLYSVVMFEEQQRAGASGIGFFLHSDIVANYLNNFGSAAQKHQWLPKMATGELIAAIAMSEPGAGSDLQNIRTRAADGGDCYIVNGAKTFITNGYLCDFVLVAVKTGPADRDEGAHSVSLLLIPANLAGFAKSKPLKKVGMKAQDTCELSFDDVRVPKGNLLGTEGTGFALLMKELAWERMIIAIQCIAGAEAALEWTLQYTSGRKVFGKPIASHQNSRFALAEMHTEVRIGRVFVDKCIELVLQNKLGPEDAAMAKYWSSELFGRVLDQCVQLHGGYGYLLEYPIARAWIDNRATRIYGGSTEVMKEIIARSL
jgi:alkylation response protein AidB-like acyl-CoA dehydrogenase